MLCIIDYMIYVVVYGMCYIYYMLYMLCYKLCNKKNGENTTTNIYYTCWAVCYMLACRVYVVYGMLYIIYIYILYYYMLYIIYYIRYVMRVRVSSYLLGWTLSSTYMYLAEVHLRSICT